MPDLAPSVDPESKSPETSSAFTRTYLDPQGRPYTGRVTARRLEAPFTSTEAEVEGGRVSLALAPGRYSIGAMLRDTDNVRAFISEDVHIQEGA